MWLYKSPNFIYSCFLHNFKVLFLCLKEAGRSVRTVPGFLHTEPWILHKPSERDTVPWPHTFRGRAGQRRCTNRGRNFVRVKRWSTYTSSGTLYLFLRLNNSETFVELVGARPLHLLTQTVPSLKSPTGAFIAAQTLIFRRKQIIRTHLLSETSSDYFCLVRVARIELTASWTPLCFSQKRNGHSDTTCTQYHQISKLFYHSVSLDVKMFCFFCGQIVVNRPWQMTILPY